MQNVNVLTRAQSPSLKRLPAPVFVPAKRLLAVAFFVLFAAGAAGASSSAFDEASFYAYPGEKPAVVQFNFSNESYYLVVSNDTPIALLHYNGTGYERVDDYDLLGQVLGANADGVYAALNFTAEQATDSAIRQAERAQYAFKRKARFLREGKLESLASNWANVSGEYRLTRKLQLPVMDTYLQRLRETLDAVDDAKTREAAGKYADQFDVFYGQALALYRAYLAVLPDYRRSSVSITNASQAVEAALKRGLIPQDEAVAARRATLAVEAELVGAENQLINGKPFFTDTPTLLADITANATAIAALNQRKPRDDTWAYVASILALVVLAFLAYFFRSRIAEFISGQHEEVKGEFSEKMEKLMNRLNKVEQESEK